MGTTRALRYEPQPGAESSVADLIDVARGLLIAEVEAGGTVDEIVLPTSLCRRIEQAKARELSRGRELTLLGLLVRSEPHGDGRDE